MTTVSLTCYQCPTHPTPLLSRSGPVPGFHSCHWDEGGFEWSLFLSYPPGIFLLLPEHQSSIWRPGCGERGSTFQSWKNFKRVHTTGTRAWLGFHSASVIPNEEGSNFSLPPKQPISIQKIMTKLRRLFKGPSWMKHSHVRIHAF